jgi:glycosyltransferase involved in cell wall biosynthesis
MRILFLGETFRADAISWFKGIEYASGHKVKTMELKMYPYRTMRVFFSFIFVIRCLRTHFGKPYDLVLAERSTSYGFFSLFINSKVRIVAQQGISDVFPLTFLSRIIKSTLQRAVYTNVDLIHAWGPAMVYAQLKSNAHPSKIIVKPKGLDLNAYTMSQGANSNYKLNAIVTRSFEKDYRHWDIIEAIKILKEKKIELNVIMVGGGSLLEEMKNLAVKLNVEGNINFTGRIDNRDLPELLRQSALYISVPVTEGVSSSLMEAMASGCLPIVTDLPGNRVFIKPGANGELVQVANAEGLANTIEKVLGNYSIYQQGIFNNRFWVEKHANHELNMLSFYGRYFEELKIKN